MASFVLQVSVGDKYLGAVRQNPLTKRWDVVLAPGFTYSFRDPDGAAEALKMLADAGVQPEEWRN